MIKSELVLLADESYKVFQSALIPNIDQDKILGVRIPVLRKFSHQIKNTDKAKDFIKTLPHEFYDEYNLHAFLISDIEDFETAIVETNRLLPYIDNWATCDSFVPRVFSHHPDKLLLWIKIWLTSDHEFTVRFAIKMLMTYFLDENFDQAYIQMVAKVKREEYYVKMMISWYFATALAKQYDIAVKYLENTLLDPWIHNKTIQKSIESLRISNDKKEYLRSLRLN